MHPDYLLDKLTASQIAEWYAYDRLDPIGEARADFRMSYLASLITNLAIQTNGKKGSKLTKISDFLIDWDYTKDTDKGTQSLEEMKLVFQEIAALSKKKEQRSLSVKNRRKPKDL